MARQQRENRPIDHTKMTKAVQEAGDTHEEHVKATSEDAAVADLKLSPIRRVSVDELKPSEYNTVFEALKSETYWTNLTRDIRETGVITDPLVVTTENEILAGHSRLRIARNLRDEGDARFETVPVRYVQSKLDTTERKQRVYLSNLNRFEIDAGTRLALRVEIYPEYYKEKQRPTGRPRKDASVSDGRKRRTSPTQIAQDNQVSKRTIQKEKEVYQAARKTAQAAGRDEPTPEDLNNVKKAKNAGKKERSAAGRSYSAGQIRNALNRYMESEQDEAKCAGVREFVGGLLNRKK